MESTNRRQKTPLSKAVERVMIYVVGLTRVAYLCTNIVPFLSPLSGMGCLLFLMIGKAALFEVDIEVSLRKKILPLPNLRSLVYTV